MPLLILGVFVVLSIIVLIPISVIQRFRVGTRRRTARRWVATLNLIAAGLSVVLFVASAFATSFWLPDALRFTLSGLGIGAALGVAGIALTRWEPVDGRWHYTPNRLLVLAITVVVAARILYGFWRTWEAWRAGAGDVTSVATAGLPTSMSAGAVVLGYYLVFWTGIRRRIAARDSGRRI